MDYQTLAKHILQFVGGKENIIHLEHCSTRLRFTLKDVKQTNREELERLDGVIGVRSNAQFQVIIGNEVVEVYDELAKLIGEISADQNINKEKKPVGTILLDFIISVFQPLIPAIAGGGVLKSLLLLLSLLGVMDTNSSTYLLLNLIGGAPLYFLPILVAMTTARKLKVNEIVAVSAVSALLLPEMATLLADGTSFLGFSIENIAYASQVFPAILTVLFYSIVEKYVTKISPKPIRIFFVPMVALLATVPVALLILGPLGYNVGGAFSYLIVELYQRLGWLATGLLAAVLPLMVVTGMHKAMIPYAVSSMGELGKEMLYLPASLAHNIAESGACFAVSLKTKNMKLRQTAISAGISALFGITEPALYGVTILHKRVLSIVMVSSFIGGIFAGIMALEAFALVGPGIASITMFASADQPMNLVWAFVCTALSFVVSFVGGLVFFKDQEEATTQEENESRRGGTWGIVSPVKGQVIPLETVPDDVFSSGMVGEGVGVIPEEGIVFSPEEAQVTMLFETGHAIGLRTVSGVELLIHVGIDTVKLQGEGFHALVQEGQMVQPGERLLEFDIEKIKQAGFDPVVVVVVTNQKEYHIDRQVENQSVTPETELLMISALAK